MEQAGNALLKQHRDNAEWNLWYTQNKSTHKHTFIVVDQDNIVT